MINVSQLVEHGSAVNTSFTENQPGKAWERLCLQVIKQTKYNYSGGFEKIRNMCGYYWHGRHLQMRCPVSWTSINKIVHFKNPYMKRVATS